MNNPLLKVGSWLLGSIFTGLGLMLVLKFGYVFLLQNGDTVQPFWVHVDMTISWGCFPLLLGILLLMRKFQYLKRIMPFTCAGGVVIFALCWISYLLSPTFIPKQLGLVAVDGLSFALLSALVWVLAFLNLRSPQKGRGGNSRRHRDESPVARVVRFRRNALVAILLGLFGIFLALSLFFVPIGPSVSHQNSMVAAILVFVPSYAATIYGCWWWVKAKNWPEAVVFIGLMPLFVLLVPFVRLIYLAVPLLLPATMVLMPIILVGVVAVLPDKSGLSRRHR